MLAAKSIGVFSKLSRLAHACAPELRSGAQLKRKRFSRIAQLFKSQSGVQLLYESLLQVYHPTTYLCSCFSGDLTHEICAIFFSCEFSYSFALDSYLTAIVSSS